MDLLELPPLVIPDTVETIVTGDIDGPNPGDMPREQWLDLRRGGVGGSDASAICGLNRFNTPLQVWMSKCGKEAGFRVPDDNLMETNDAVLMGVLLEDVVADRLLPIKQPQLTVVKPGAMYWDQAQPFPRFANPDRFVYDPDVEAWCPLEVKTCGQWSAADWSIDGEPADHALVQGIHYADILGMDWLWVIVLIGGQRPVTFRVEVDHDFAHDIAELEHRFWDDHVIPRRPPAAAEADTDIIDSLFESIEGRVDLPAEAEDLWEQIQAASEAETAARAVKKAATNELKLLMGGEGTAAKEGWLDGRKLCTWSQFDQTRVPSDNIDEMKVKHPRLFRQYAVTTPTRRFTAAKSWATK